MSLNNTDSAKVAFDCEKLGLSHRYEFVVAAHGSQVFRCTECHSIDDVAEDGLTG